MLCSLLLFSGVDVTNKILGETLPVAQIIWIRYLAFVPIAAAVAYRPGRGVVWRSARPYLQVLRSLLLVTEMGLFVWALKFLPLVDVQAIGASCPLLVIALSVPLLGEAVGWRRWTAVAVGFVGVVLIVRPGFQEFGLGSALAMVGTVLWALYQVLLRIVGRHDSASVTGVWTAIVGFVVTSCIAPFAWTPPDAKGWVLLVAIALLGAFGHILYGKAFVLARAAILQPFNYLLLVFAAVFGWLVFGHFPDHWTIAGASLIVASGLYALHREHIRASDPGSSG